MEVDRVMKDALIAAALVSLTAYSSLDVIRLLSGFYRATVRQVPRRAVVGEASRLHSGDRESIVGQMCDFCNLMVAALRSGQTTPQAFHTVLAEVEQPLRRLLGFVEVQYSLGTPIHVSLAKAGTVSRSVEMVQIARILQLVAMTGSDPCNAILEVGTAARERVESRAVLRSKISDARVSAIVVALLPPVLVLASYITQPSVVVSAVLSNTGRYAMGIGVLLWVGGIASIWKAANPSWL